MKKTFSIGAVDPDALFSNYRVHRNGIMTYASIQFSLGLCHLSVEMFTIEAPHILIAVISHKIGAYTLITEILHNFPLKRSFTDFQSIKADFRHRYAISSRDLQDIIHHTANIFAPA